MNNAADVIAVMNHANPFVQFAIPEALVGECWFISANAVVSRHYYNEFHVQKVAGK